MDSMHKDFFSKNVFPKTNIFKQKLQKWLFFLFAVRILASYGYKLRGQEKFSSNQ